MTAWTKDYDHDVDWTSTPQVDPRITEINRRISAVEKAETRYDEYGNWIGLSDIGQTQIRALEAWREAVIKEIEAEESARKATDAEESRKNLRVVKAVWVVFGRSNNVVEYTFNDGVVGAHFKLDQEHLEAIAELRKATGSASELQSACQSAGVAFGRRRM